MSTLTASALRQALATRIEGLTGWWEAPVAFDAFNVSGVPESVPATKAHLAFAVGLPTTAILDDRERQRPADGVMVQTDLRVRFLARFVPGPTKAQASIDAALDAEQALINRLMVLSPTWPATFRIVLNGTPSRTLIATGEWFLHEVAFTVYHRLPLE